MTKPRRYRIKRGQVVVGYNDVIMPDIDDLHRESGLECREWFVAWSVRAATSSRATGRISLLVRKGP